jgi:UDP-N-acetyl-D-mannosaminuronic acid transferase (WecB/TagA/CpsF family)
MASPASAGINLAYLRGQGINVRDEDVYLAPRYAAEISDPGLLEEFHLNSYKHVILTVGGGTQERLGLYLKRSLARTPAIHCIGAAIAFLSGDQVHIPTLVDKLGLGWLWRCVSKPSLYVPRYWAARKLFGLMVRYRDRMPPLSATAPS